MKNEEERNRLRKDCELVIVLYGDHEDNYTAVTNTITRLWSSLYREN